MPPAEPVLICALSGRALAQSARAAGFAPIVLDAFADLDTREAGALCRRIPVDAHWRLRRGALLAAAARLAPPPIPLVWGSGFERAPDLLAELAEGRPLWGTEPAVVRALKDPIRFAATAQVLGIPHPETRAEPPAHPRGWLCKRSGAAGGGHVRRAPAAGRPAGHGWYWQRIAVGRPVSALVAGNGIEALVLSFSEQWPAPARGRRFRFGGVLAPAGLSATARERLGAAAAALAAHYGIRGLASVDALVAGDAVTILELNPRPGASLEAYEQAHGVSLFAVHRAACAGEPLTALPPAGRIAGTEIVYASRGMVVPPGFVWPDWTADRTPDGSMIRAGEPVCTVRASGADRATVKLLLRERRRRVSAPALRLAA
ncbi:ATP-grasp domain-containing protein [Benzoatithermus flavus]|uniref:ATP-grasp domain-containing protein n=1 Tax=Benzoatithermus flavus TaxID=3108223 RepID=A0ABU8XP88_9PROT